MKCKECYSDNARITPLLKPLECLNMHTQYICGSCGRCICIEHDPIRNLQRWNFPFKTVDIAMLYLRAAEFTTKTNCAIYEITNEQGRISYKIFENQKSVDHYRGKHHKNRCSFVYQNDAYHEYPNTMIRKLTEEEVYMYLDK